MAEPLLKKGLTGQPVKDFEQGLKDLGYDPGAVDGLTEDGVVGPQTWKRIDALGD